jgi:hypothetical protein
MPYGNNDYGKDSRESTYKAIKTYDYNGKTGRVATGTGPITWSHDKTLGGIWDLNGNVWEWNGGLRTVYGEVQVLANNNAADEDNSQSATSAQWKAIDATTGDLITPSGDGTTANSIKIDWLNSKWTYSTSITVKADASHDCDFVNLTCDSTISDAAQAVLRTLALLPVAGEDYEGDHVWMNNGAAERCFCAGGYFFGYAARAGVFALDGHYPRSNSIAGVGFRSAFAKLPSD